MKSIPLCPGILVEQQAAGCVRHGAFQKFGNRSYTSAPVNGMVKLRANGLIVIDDIDDGLHANPPPVIFHCGCSPCGAAGAHLNTVLPPGLEPREICPPFVNDRLTG